MKISNSEIRISGSFGTVPADEVPRRRRGHRRAGGTRLLTHALPSLRAGKVGAAVQPISDAPRTVKQRSCWKRGCGGQPCSAPMLEGRCQFGGSNSASPRPKLLFEFRPAHSSCVVRRRVCAGVVRAPHRRRSRWTSSAAAPSLSRGRSSSPPAPSRGSALRSWVRWHR